MIKAYIDPSSQVYYASFYIQGLYDSIGKPNISFSAKYFKDLRRNEGRTAYDVYFAFVLINDGVITKYVEKKVINGCNSCKYKGNSSTHR